MNKMNKSTPVVKAKDGCQPNDFYHIASQGLVIVTENEIAPLNSTFWPFCDGEEYTLVGNSSAVTCLRNGSWHIPPQMKCVEGCANFDTGPNGPRVAGRKRSYALGDSVTLSCSEGTRLQPRVERIICLGYSWSESAVPVCVPVPEKSK
uniref:Sushi domain (Scr repeat) domain containing protein n=1 Tax=Rhipicephalus appendiculatus TaxID=34631 RepID=A0A131YDS8_RHIAP